eukprot:TRINITY_DN8075_c0_g1_i1.p1 TRINITY_DN8075_c0_g1~~TRINITY_DN8075_c0_g1_i1.p1  ORF type:complete len:476 (-),score=93.79 TRINITY_DN8075_c0_g1_i1:877-2304(-)
MATTAHGGIGISINGLLVTSAAQISALRGVIGFDAEACFTTTSCWSGSLLEELARRVPSLGRERTHFVQTTPFTTPEAANSLSPLASKVEHTYTSIPEQVAIGILANTFIPCQGSVLLAISAQADTVSCAMMEVHSAYDFTALGTSRHVTLTASDGNVLDALDAFFVKLTQCTLKELRAHSEYCLSMIELAAAIGGEAQVIAKDIELALSAFPLTPSVLLTRVATYNSKHPDTQLKVQTNLLLQLPPSLTNELRRPLVDTIVKQAFDCYSGASVPSGKRLYVACAGLMGLSAISALQMTFTTPMQVITFGLQHVTVVTAAAQGAALFGKHSPLEFDCDVFLGKKPVVRLPPANIPRVPWIEPEIVRTFDYNDHNSNSRDETCALLAELREETESYVKARIAHLSVNQDTVLTAANRLNVALSEWSTMGDATREVTQRLSANEKCMEDMKADLQRVSYRLRVAEEHKKVVCNCALM